MACNSYICPGEGSIYINTDSGDAAFTVPNSTAKVNYNRMPEILSWALEATTDDPVTFRTADTAGTKVKANCGVATEWTVTATAKLCAADWIYDKLLVNPGSPTLWASGSSTLQGWFYLTWDQPASYPGSGVLQGSGNPAATNPGIYLFGAITPGGFTINNDEDTVAEVEFGINVTVGPFFPNPPFVAI